MSPDRLAAAMRSDLAAVVALAATAAAVGLLLGASPGVGLVFGAAIAACGLAVGLRTRMDVSPMWLLVPVALTQPMNGVRPSTNVTIGDVLLVLTGAAMLPFLPWAKANRRLVVPLLGVLMITAGGLFGEMATEGTRTQELLSGLQTITALNQTSNLLGAGTAGSSLLRFILGAPCVLIIFLLINPDPKSASNLAKWYAVGAAISAVAGILGYNVNSYYQRAVGLAAHFLHFGLTSLFGTAIAIGWYVSATARWSRIVAMIIGGLCAYGVLLSGARSALLGLLAVLIFFAMLGRGRGMVLLAVFSVLGTLGLYFATPYMPQGSALYRLFGSSAKLSNQVSGSNEQHLQALKQAIDQISLHPWTGTGFANALTAHNLELEAADVGGLIGLGGLLLVWGTVFFLLGRMLRYGLPASDWARAAPLVGMFGYFVLAQFENIFWDRHLWFILSVALIAAPGYPVRRRRAAPDAPAEIETREAVTV